MFTIINMNKNNDIQNNEECDKLLDDILRELEIAKDQSNAIANKLHNIFKEKYMVYYEYGYFPS